MRSCTLAGNLELCYAIVLPGRKSGFRDGFRPDSIRESLNIGPRAGLQADGGPILRLSRLESGRSSEALFCHVPHTPRLILRPLPPSWGAAPHFPAVFCGSPPPRSQGHQETDPDDHFEVRDFDQQAKCSCDGLDNQVQRVLSTETSPQKRRF